MAKQLTDFEVAVDFNKLFTKSLVYTSRCLDFEYFLH